MIDVPIPFGHRDLVVGLDVDHGIDGLGGHRRDHVVDVHAHLLEVALLEAGAGDDHVHENIADRGAGLVCDLEPLELADLGEIEVLAGHDLRGLADIFDLGDRNQAALVVADDERLRGVGAHVHLPRHHLLHGEIARGHGELLELDAVLLQQARLAAGNRSASPRCWSGSPGGRSRARLPVARRRGPPPPGQRRREIFPSCQVNAPVPHRVSSVMFVATGVFPPLWLDRSSD